MSIKDKYAIVGLGCTKQGRLPDMTENGIRAEAILNAIADAGIRKDEIDGYVYQAGGAAWGGGDVPRMVGIRPKFIWSLQSGGATAISTLISAIGAIESGAAEVVVSSYASNWLSGQRLVGAPQPGMDRSTGGAFGMFGPGPDHALAARRHMHEFGTTSQQMGAISVTQRAYANKRPEAHMHSRAMTLEDHQVSRMIAGDDPERLDERVALTPVSERAIDHPYWILPGHGRYRVHALLTRSDEAFERRVGGHILPGRRADDDQKRHQAEERGGAVC